MSAVVIFPVFEKTLNICGYIPAVSSVSGPIRALYGKAKIITGIAAAIFSASGVITLSPTIAPILATHLIFSGLIELFRGAIETIPVFGNIACIIHDFI